LATTAPALTTALGPAGPTRAAARTTAAGTIVASGSAARTRSGTGARAGAGTSVVAATAAAAGTRSRGCRPAAAAARWRRDRLARRRTGWGRDGFARCRQWGATRTGPHRCGRWGIETGARTGGRWARRLGLGRWRRGLDDGGFGARGPPATARGNDPGWGRRRKWRCGSGRGSRRWGRSRGRRLWGRLCRSCGLGRWSFGRDVGGRDRLVGGRFLGWSRLLGGRLFVRGLLGGSLLFGLFVADQTFTISLAANAVGLSIDDARRVALDADA
jgi:hypothetical protein